MNVRRRRSLPRRDSRSIFCSLRTSSCSFSCRNFCKPGKRKALPRPIMYWIVGVAVRVGEVAQRALHLADEIVEHRLERGQNLLQVGRLGGVALEVLGLGEGQLEVLGQGAGEVVAAQRNGPLPDDLLAVGDDQVGVVGADVQGDDALFLSAPLPLRLAPAVPLPSRS